MAVFKRLSVLLVVAGPCAWTTPQFPSLTPTTTPVPILRYIDKQNTDGSYTYGFEGADGTYKLETRFADGRVKGKYGYIDQAAIDPPNCGPVFARNTTPSCLQSLHHLRSWDEKF